MADPKAELDAVRDSLGRVLGSLQVPGNPPACAQAATFVASALRSVHWMAGPGQNPQPLAAQALNNVQQAHHMLEPLLGQSPAWQPLDAALHAAFNTLSAIASGVPAPAAAPLQQRAAQPPDPASMARESWAVALLVMRHLYDGDAIDWPLASDHPQFPVFHQLESLGYIARWDRTWPLHDRYRLTEKGIREIEKHYRPADAERIFQQVRQANAGSPKARQAVLRQQGIDPWHWSVLHDPYTHWSTWDSDHGSYHRYFWQAPAASRRSSHNRKDSQAHADEPVGRAVPADQPWIDDRHVTVPLDEPAGVGGTSHWDDAPVRDLS